jgi:UDP-galactopyranose mutase
LIKRAAQDRRVFFVEEPVFDGGTMRLEVAERENGVKLVVPHLPDGLRSSIATNAILQEMMTRLTSTSGIHDFVLWYYTPMALSFTSDMQARAIIYDCMDELSAFKNAPDDLKELELELFNKADLVFTGGQSLFEVKRLRHPAVHCFPSSIERDHFAQARTAQDDPADQEQIPHPRLGFFGVIDERFDIQLLESLAAARPDWHFVMLGPVVKIDQSTLPHRPNIHYLGSKSYNDLPKYIANWDVALLLFALNDATRFISPTKTPEYLAAGKQVVSTPIRDVVNPYGANGLVHIAANTNEFISAIEDCLTENKHRSDWLERTDEFLARMSWDDTWNQMSQLIDGVLHLKGIMKAKVAEAVTNRATSASF